MSKAAKQLFALFFSKDRTISRQTSRASPRLSVVTPVRNTGEILNETAWSLQNQSFRNFEWVLVDDGSNCVRTKQVLEDIVRKDERARILHSKSPGGIGAARNLGARRAKTSLLYFLDSDDLLESTAFEKFYLAYTSNPNVTCVTSYNGAFGGQSYLWNLSEEKVNNLLTANPFVSGYLLEKKLWRLAGGFPESGKFSYGGEDWMMWVKLFRLNSFKMHIIPEYLFWYRKPSAAQMRRKWPNLRKPYNLFDLNDRKKTSRFVNAEKTNLREDLAGYPKHRHGVAIQRVRPSKKPAKRLLMFIPYLQMGGADMFNLNAIKELTERQWEVTVATTLKDSHPWFQEFYKRSSRVFHITHLAAPKSYWAAIRYLIHLTNPQVLMISNSAIAYHMLPLIREEFPNITCVDYNHMEEPDWENGGHALSGVYWQPFLDLSLVSSKHLKRWMILQGASSKTMTVCYTGIEVRSPAREKNHTSPKSKSSISSSQEYPVIVFPARLVWQKQPLVFLATLKVLKEKGHQFTAKICGCGPLEKEVKEAIELHGLQSHVTLLGAVGNEQLHNIYSNSHILLLPSKNEGISLAIHEAMSHGMVVVGADVGGQSELVRPSEGFLVKPSTPDVEAVQYANIIGMLLKDPGRRQAIGQKARRRILRRFTTHHMGEQLDNLLTKAMDTHNTTRHAQAQVAREKMTSRLIQLVVRGNAQ